MHVDHAVRLGLQAEGLGLLVVVLQHEVGDRFAHSGEQLVALLVGQVSGGDHGVDQDLDVHLAIRAVDPAELSIASVFASAAERVLDPRRLRPGRVPALAHHAAAQLVGVHPDRSFALSPASVCASKLAFA